MPGKIFIVCPAGLVTGGAELLHQLTHELRSLGREAFISYWPFGQAHVREPAYLKYEAPTAPIEDDLGNQVIFPEVLTKATRLVRHAECAVWWLSVDNYYLFPQDYRLLAPWVYRRNRLYDPIRRVRSLQLSRRPLNSLRDMIHYAQSEYARSFLAKSGIAAYMLTDYLSDEHLDAPMPGGSEMRRNVIAYNPKKGLDITTRLKAAFPDVAFEPIQNMTSAEVAAFLRSSKLYIDFGNHPGKDRPPREAVMAGCCVMTGRSGAAAHHEDTPIPDTYRLDPLSKDFLTRFETSMKSIFAHFEERRHDFDLWRDRIRQEKQQFKSQVARLFGPAGTAQ